MEEFRRAMPRRREWAYWAAVLPVWVLLLLRDSMPLAFTWFLLSRAAYVLFVGVSLRAQGAGRWYTRRFGAEEGFRRFRAGAAVLMTNDAVAIGLVAWAGRGTLEAPLHPLGMAVLGGALFAGGVGVRAWATASLPAGAFFWKGCFIPSVGQRFVTRGPYRWLAHPMYTVGYLHAYGVAIFFRSLPGLAAAVVAQALILVMNRWAERPHTESLRQARGLPARGPAARRVA